MAFRYTSRHNDDNDDDDDREGDYNLYKLRLDEAAQPVSYPVFVIPLGLESITTPVLNIQINSRILKSAINHPSCPCTKAGCREKAENKSPLSSSSQTLKLTTPSAGLTADPIGRFIKKTLLNPVFTILFILAAHFTKTGSDLSIIHDTAFSWIKTLFYLGLIRWVSGYLDTGSLNNWTTDAYDWEKEIVLITGGSGGIGGNVVKLLAEMGIKVVVMDVIPITFDAPENVYYYKCDITSPSLIASTAAKIFQDVGRPTILINNAGVARGKSILNATEKDVRFTFDVNTLAHYWIAREFLPSIVKRNHGMVVTVSSYAAYITVPNMTDYAASKVAALSFHEGLTAELKMRYNAPRVRTAVIIPGHTKTPLFQGYSNDSRFLVPTLEPQTVAEAIVKQVLTGRSGQVIIPGFGSVMAFLRGFPHWMQLNVRSDGERAMTKWDGRQVIDLEKWKAGNEKEAESA